MKPRIYVLFVFDLDSECEFIKNKTIYTVSQKTSTFLFLNNSVKN